MDVNSTVKLNNGIQMPWLGLGVWQSQEGEEAKTSVLWALEAGYRHIDTAAGYGNENSVGQAVKDSGIRREEIFVTTKMRPNEIEAGEFDKAFHDSLEKLDIGYIDLYLIHWPVPGYVDAWRKMEQWYKQGKIRAIGVSNFHTKHLERLAEECEIVPAVDQIELHPHLSQEQLCEYLWQKGIVPEAWSPLGHGTLLQDETLQAIGAKYNKSTAQVMIRWELQNMIVTIPKSVNKERIIENCSVFDFELSEADMKVINTLNIDRRTGRNPDVYNEQFVSKI